MAVSDEIIVIAIGLATNYLIIYKKSRILGNIIFMGLSISIMAFAVNDTLASVGLMMLLGSMFSAVHDVITPRKKR